MRVIFAVAALSLSAPALACGGGACDKGHCKMQEKEVVDAALQAVDTAEGAKISFSVTGMTCGSCGDKLTSALSTANGVNAAYVSHAEGLAKVAFDASKTDAAALMTIITEAGFGAEKAES